MAWGISVPVDEEVVLVDRHKSGVYEWKLVKNEQIIISGRENSFFAAMTKAEVAWKTHSVKN
jgi:hypothetical protein